MTASSTTTAKEVPEEEEVQSKQQQDDEKKEADQQEVDGSPVAKAAKDPEQQSSVKARTQLSIASSGSNTDGIPGAFRVSPSTRSSTELNENENSDHNSSESNPTDSSTDHSLEDHHSPEVTITTNEITETEVTDADVEAAIESASSPQVTTAYLVQEKLVAKVETIKPFYQRTEGKRTIGVITCLVVSVAILLGVLLSNRSADQEEPLVPSMAPSQAPTFDPRPTREVVQERGFVNCGIEDVAEGTERFGQYNMDFCRGLAAVLFGDPERFRAVSVGDDRYFKLLGREVDVLLAGDTLTVEKLIREPTTGLGFAFGYPFYGAAVVYAGPPKYVQCANAQKRYEECEDLSICAVDTPDLLSLLPQFFPESFITYGAFPLMEKYLKEGKCNVIVSDTYRLSGSSLQSYIDNGEYVISGYHISRNLLSSVVRYGDVEWYDIVEGSRLSQFRASQMRIYQDTSACDELEEPSDSVAFYNSPICVGNSVQTFQRSLGETVISFGGLGYLSAIDAPTYGSLECSDCVDVLDSGKLKEITERGHFDCAVYLDPVHNLTRSSLATLMNEKFCQLLGVAIFQGDSNATKITYIDRMDYTEFPSDYDVVAGAGWEGKTDNGWDSTNAGSMVMTYTYYVHDKYRHDGEVYDGIGVHLTFAIDTQYRDLNLLASAVIIATINAQRQGITKETHSEMPLIYLFGDSLTFMFRDVIAHGGNYDEIVQEALANSDGTTEITWNTIVPNYSVAAQTPVLYCDYTGNCPPCMWYEVEGFPVCVSEGPY